jgi:hypothetical protein
MTAEEMEVAYCKARRTCMKSFRMWLREHIQIAKEAAKLGLSSEQVQKLTIAAMTKAEEEITKELAGGAELISERDDKPRPLSDEELAQASESFADTVSGSEKP